jgi:hypothetical protein
MVVNPRQSRKHATMDAVDRAYLTGTGRSDDEFLPTTAAILAVPLTASLTLDPRASLFPLR